MPIALIYTLRPQQPVRVPMSLGRAAHAMILAMINHERPEIAARLHSANELRPLTVSNPLGLVGPGATVWLEPERHYRLRVTTLNDELEHLAQSWLAAPPKQISLGGATWEVERVTARTRDDPWTGRTTYASLLGEAFQRAEDGPGRWTLEFASPVSFRQRGMCQPLPLPELVFGSLLERWNAMAPVPLPNEVRCYAAEALIVSRFDLHSAVEVSKGGNPQVGVVGRCTYIAREHDPTLASCIEALTRFALYSGVGAGTARGLGQTRIIASGTRTRRDAPLDKPSS